MTFERLYQIMLNLLPADLPKENRKVSIVLHADNFVLLRFEWMEIEALIECGVEYPLGLPETNNILEEIYKELEAGKENILKQIEVSRAASFNQPENPSLH